MIRKSLLNHANRPTTNENSIQEQGSGTKFRPKVEVGMLATMWMVFSSDLGRPLGQRGVPRGVMLLQLLNPNHFASFFFGWNLGIGMQSR